jgi:hypothetical protein
MSIVILGLANRLHVTGVCLYNFAFHMFMLNSSKYEDDNIINDLWSRIQFLMKKIVGIPY